MYGNKMQEQFILNARKQKAEKDKKKAVSKQKTSSTKAQATAKIDQQKLNYNLAAEKNDYIGKRVANVEANKVRDKAGLPHYSSAVGDKQASLTNAKSITGLKQNVSQQMASNANKQVANLSANHPLNREKKTVSPIPKRVLNDMFDKDENYVDKFKKGNIGGGVASLVGETIQLPQSGLMNISNNINSVTHSKGLQPYKRMMDYTDYENEIRDRNNVKPLSQLIGEKNKTLGNMYSVGMDIATDPLNLLDVGAVQTAKQLKTLGSAKYADNLVNGEFVPVVLKSGKKVASTADLKDLKTSEKAEAVQAINNNRKKLATTTAKGNAKPLVQTSKIQEKELSNSKFFRLDDGISDVSGHIPKDGRLPFIDQIYYSSKLADDVTNPANIPSQYKGKGHTTKAVESVIDYLKQNKQDKFQIQIMNEHSKKLMDRLVKQGKAKQLTDYKFDGDDVTYAIPQASNQAVQPQNIDLGNTVQQEPKILYTGSSNPNIERFIAGGNGSTKTSGDSFGMGVYLTDNPEVAKHYAQGENGRVYKVSSDHKTLDLDEKSDNTFAQTVSKYVNNSDKDFKNNILRKVGRKEIRFTNTEDGLKFFENQTDNWKTKDGYYDGNKPSVSKKGEEFIITYTDFDSDLKNSLKTVTNKQIFESLSAVDSNMASELVSKSGYDGISFNDKGAFQGGIGGKTHVIYNNTDKIKIHDEPKPTVKAPSIEDKMKLIEAEHNRTVDTVYKYLNEYKPKGVDINFVPKNNEYGVEEYVRQNASLNDKWYQDFYKENGRKPNKSEMRELAEKLVIRDLDDIHGEFHNADLADMINKLDEPQNNAIEPQTFKRGTNTPKRPFQSVGADLNSNPPKYKVSQLRTNTVENSEQFANLKGDMPQENFEYEVRPEKVTKAEAKQRLETDFEGEVDDLYFKTNFDGADTDTAMGIAKTYGEEAEQTGNYTRLNNWSKQIQEKATEQGQAIQAFSKYTRTPEGKVIEGQKEVAKVQREIAKDNPRLTDKVNQETKSIIDVISGAEKETLESISEMINKMLKGEEATPSDLLARKVISTTKTPKVKENAINDMVNELFRVAKESPLPSTLKTKSNPVDYLAKAIQNKELYTDTWNKAKDVIKAKYDGKEEVLNMLDDYFDKGIIPTYSKATIDKSIRQTAKELTVDFSKIIKQSAGDKGKALQDITDLLINKTGATGEDASLLAKNITDQYNAILKARTESTLKQMFREVPKKGQKTTYQKVMELINMGAYDNQAIKDIIRAKNNIPVMDNEDIKGIFENMKKAESETDPYMKRMYEAKAQQIISDKIPATFMEKFAGLQRQSMLINPKTLLTRNPFGNLVLGTAENFKDIPGSIVDSAISLKTGRRTTTLNPHIGAQLKGGLQGVGEWKKDIRYGVDTSPTRAQFELPNKRIFDNPVLNATDRFLSRALQLGDRPFYQGAYDGRIAELKALGVTGEEAEIQARLFALDRVFQNDSVLSKNALIIRDKLGIFGRLVMPFAQTPANIMDKLLDYSPVGLGKAIYHLGTTAGKGTFDQKLFVDRLGRTMTGTGIAMLGYAMAEKGLLTGNEYDPTNKDLNAAKAMAGTQSYALKVGDKWHSYDFAQPIGGILAAAADAYNAGQDGKDFVGSLVEGSKAAVNTVFNQSFMSGLLDAFSGYSPAEGIGGALLSSTTQITPTILNNVTKTIDPYTRETYDPNAFKQQGNKLLARIPFASKMLPKKLDATGQPMMQNQGRGTGEKTLENFLLPQKVTEVERYVVNDELLRLNKATGENEMLLNVAPKQFSKGGQTYTLSSKDYTNYQKTMGQYANKKMAKLMETESYKKLPDIDKVDKLQKINESATEQARMEYFENNGMSPLLALDKSVQKKYEKVKDTGITDKQFIQAKKKLAGLSKQEEVQAALDSTKLTQAQKEAMWYASNKSWTETSNPYKDKNTDFNFDLMSDSKKQKFLLVANKGVTKQQFANAMGRADTDNNGSLKKDELKQAMVNAGFTKEQRRTMYQVYFSRKK